MTFGRYSESMLYTIHVARILHDWLLIMTYEAVECLLNLSFRSPALDFS